jgi:hypothetical protein
MNAEAMTRKQIFVITTRVRQDAWRNEISEMTESVSAVTSVRIMASDNEICSPITHSEGRFVCCLIIECASLHCPLELCTRLKLNHE